MPKVYQLKKNPFDRNRIMKCAKEIMDEGGVDRQHALDTAKYYRQKMEDHPEDFHARERHIDCLKLAQMAKNNSIKILAIMVKIDESMKDKDPLDEFNLIALN